MIPGSQGLYNRSKKRAFPALPSRRSAPLVQEGAARGAGDSAEPSTVSDLRKQLQAAHVQGYQEPFTSSTKAEDIEFLRAYSSHSLETLRECVLGGKAWVTPIAFPHFTAAVALHLRAQDVCSDRQQSYESLAEEWDRQHLGIRSRDLGNAKTVAHTACQDAGFCVCSARARWIALFKARAMRALKDASPPASTHRELLISGRVLLLWSPTVPEQRGVGSADPSGSSTAVGDGVVEDSYTHVSLMYIKPWRPTLTKMARISQTHFEVLGDAEGRPSLSTMWQWARDLCKEFTWSLTLLELKGANGIMDGVSFDLRNVSAQVLTEPVTFWQGMEREHRRVPPPEVSRCSCV